MLTCVKIYNKINILSHLIYCSIIFWTLNLVVVSEGYAEKIPGKVIDVGASRSNTSAFSCAFNVDNELYCWGANSSGYLGLNDTANRNNPKKVALSVKQLSVGSNHACAIDTEGKLYCWGDNTYGQLGVGDSGSRVEPVHIGSDTYESVSAGDSHTCAINSDGKLFCWGLNRYGELGINSQTNANTPRQVGNNVYKSVSAGGSRTCAIDTVGDLYCWGMIYQYTPIYGPVPDPVQKTPLKVGSDTYNSVSSGSSHTCAINTLGKLFCWGSNNRGQLGLGSEDTGFDTPQEVGENTYSFVSAGYDHTCAITTLGELFCFGLNSSGQLGVGNAQLKYTSPQEIDDDYERVSAGYTHTCGIKTDGSVRCWGNNTQGALGNGTMDFQLVYDGSQYTGLLGGKKATTLSLSKKQACAINENNDLYCWGCKTNTHCEAYPKKVKNGSDDLKVKKISVGENHACAVSTDEKLYCWGSNDNNQLNGATAGATPQYIMGDIIDVACGDIHTCAIKTDGTVVCFGDNSQGSLADADSSNHLIRDTDGNNTGLVGGYDAVRIVAKYNKACAINSVNEIYCWGDVSSSLTKMTTPDNTILISNLRVGAISNSHRIDITVDDVPYWCFSDRCSQQTRESDDPSCVPVNIYNIKDYTYGNNEYYLRNSGVFLRIVRYVGTGETCRDVNLEFMLGYVNVDIDNPLYGMKLQAEKFESTSNYICAIDVDGRLSCRWEQFSVDNGQLGNNTNTYSPPENPLNIPRDPTVDCTNHGEGCCYSILYDKIGSSCTNGRTGSCNINGGTYICGGNELKSSVICEKDGHSIDNETPRCCYDIQRLSENNITSCYSKNPSGYACYGTGTYECGGYLPTSNMVCNAKDDKSKAGDEICGDGIDNDCDGTVDEDKPGECIYLSENICLFDDNFKFDGKLENVAIKDLAYADSGEARSGKIPQYVVAAISDTSFKGVKKYKVLGDTISEDRNPIAELGADPIALDHYRGYTAVIDNSNTLSIISSSGTTCFTTLETGTNPSAVAINDKYVVVTNKGKDNISVFDRACSQIGSNINVESQPIALALYKAGNTNYAIVVNAKKGSASIVNLDNRDVKNITVGKNPNSVAVSSDGKKAAVANFSSNTVSYISLDKISEADIQTLETERYPQEVIIADIDGNGYEDVVTANYSGSISALYNMGKDSKGKDIFRPMSNLSLETTPVSLLAFQTMGNTSYGDGNNRLSLLVAEENKTLNLYQHRGAMFCKDYCSNRRFSEHVELSSEDNYNDITLTEKNNLLATSDAGIHLYSAERQTDGKGTGNFTYMSMPVDGNSNLISSLNEESFITTSGAYVAYYEDINQRVKSQGSFSFAGDKPIYDFTKGEDAIWTSSLLSGIGKITFKNGELSDSEIVIKPSGSGVTQYNGLAVGDFFSKNDLVYTTPLQGKVIVLKGGVRGNEGEITTEFFPKDVVIANADGDTSSNELVVAEGCSDLDTQCKKDTKSKCCEKDGNYYKYSGVGRLTIYDKNAKPKETYTLDSLPQKLYKVDMDNNGAEDIIVLTEKALTIFYNYSEKGKMNLNGVSYPFSEKPTSFVARDLNGDGLKDFALLVGKDKVKIYLQNPVNEDKGNKKNYCEAEPVPVSQNPNMQWGCPTADKNSGYCGCGRGNNTKNLLDDDGDFIPDCVDENNRDRQGIVMNNNTKLLAPYAKKSGSTAEIYFERFGKAKRNKKDVKVQYQVEIRRGAADKACGQLSVVKTTKVGKLKKLSIGLAKKDKSAIAKNCIRYRGVLALTVKNNPKKLPVQYTKWSPYTVVEYKGKDENKGIHYYAGGDAFGPKKKKNNKYYQGADGGAYRSEVVNYDSFIGRTQ